MHNEEISKKCAAALLAELAKHRQVLDEKPGHAFTQPDGASV